MDKKTISNRYIETFGIIVIALALGRCAVHQSTTQKAQPAMAAVDSITEAPIKADTDSLVVPPSEAVHRILSVPNYKEAFPDSNSQQLAAAQRWGVPPVKNRQNAERRKDELVFVGVSPYYHVDPLHASIPYLVPRAALLLQDIGRAFFDSLHVKGVPFHRPIVTSVLRTEEDVVKLRRYNHNATDQSCHLYGTTFDLCYNRYKVVDDPEGTPRRTVRNDTLKWVLAEVLRDKRNEGRCYIKYEVKQGCFHMTVR